MIEDGKTGFLMENGSSEDLKLSINKLLALTDGEYQDMKWAIIKKFEFVIKEDRLSQLINYYKEVIQQFNAAE